MKLYEIDREIESLVDPGTGEILDFEAFTSLQMAREAKIENMALWAKNLTAEADAIKAERNNLTDRERAARNKADSLKYCELFYGLSRGPTKLVGPRLFLFWVYYYQ